MLEAVRSSYYPNQVDASLFLQMRYETAFGIFNHDGPDLPDVPWPLMAVSPREDTTRVDPLDFRLDQYAENRVFEIFGIPFDELIQFERRDFLKVINSAKKHSARLAGTGNKELNKLMQSFEGIAKHQNQQLHAQNANQQRRK